jgi:hydrogenase-4 component B
LNFSSDPTISLLIAATILALSGLPGVTFLRPVPGQWCAAGAVVVAAIIGEIAVMALLNGTPGGTYQLDWPLPFGPAVVGVDHLTTIFLLPLFLVAGCVAVYALAYWPAHEQRSAGRVTLFLGVFAAAMVLVVLARHGVLFLMAWEVMAIASYFLLTAEQERADVQRIGSVYLITTHVGTMALFVIFSLLRGAVGSFAFPATGTLAHTMPGAAVVLAAALIGFGAKAGLMPLHFWLPGAHANAPSHVSAMMSGVMLKMGIYGLLRTFAFFDQLPVWLGWLVLVLGAWSAVNGIALAAGQRDLKRLLACSSIENIGIICIGIGMALVGRQLHAPYLVVCGLCGAFIHVINHSLFKSLLFLGSGVVVHATGTREIDRLGGLARTMPITSSLCLVGSIAICGLPPLNGFVGELFLYVGAITNGIYAPLPLLAMVAPLLAVVGGLAVITFVKLYGIAFLGVARSEAAARSHDAPAVMTGPMVILALACLATGLGPLVLVRLVTPVVAGYGNVLLADVTRIAGQVPLVPLTMANMLLLFLGAVIGMLYLHRLRRLPHAASTTWGCGYLAPTRRMQYTGTSFSELAVNMVQALVAPCRRRPQLAQALPAPEPRFTYQVTEMVLDRVLAPIFHWVGVGFHYLRKVQHGQLHIYVLYIFATLSVLMIMTG